MACAEDSQEKCFAFIWHLENVSYLWQKKGECILSPSFVVDEIEETKWAMKLIPKCGETENLIGLYLQREADSQGPKSVRIGYDLSVLLPDGTVLENTSKVTTDFRKKQCFGSFRFANRTDVFKRSLFMPHDTLTARCRLWKSDGNISKDVQCVARTLIGVERRSFIWNIEHFSALVSGETLTYEIKSLSDGNLLLSLDLFVTNRLYAEEIHFAVTPMDQKIKSCNLELLPINASGRTVDCVMDYFFQFDVPNEKVISERFFVSSYIEDKKSEYLQNDVFSLLCVCHFSSGIQLEGIERVSSDSLGFDISEPKNCLGSEEGKLAGHKNILSDDLKSMLSCNVLSDLNLRISNKTYPVHKCILSARSPVFKAMFLKDMEIIEDCLDIQGLNPGTVFHMLRYIYCAEVENLEWRDAIELHEAANIYQISHLRLLCSSYLKKHLSRSNACEVLVLADLRHDEDLKSFVQDFIVRHCKIIMNSEEWKQLMKTNLELAAETMHLKFKE